MSFQDFAGSNKTSRPSGRAPTRPTGNNNSAASAGGQDSLRPISESLLQYQVRKEFKLWEFLCGRRIFTNPQLTSFAVVLDNNN